MILHLCSFLLSTRPRRHYHAVIAVIGAGAMGAALAILHHRAGSRTALLGTRFDDAAIDACGSRRPHPALGIPLPPEIDCRRHGAWGAVVQNAERIVLGVSSDGLSDVVAEIAPRARPHAVWIVATKGWNADTLRTPSEVIDSLVERTEAVAVLAGPALAPELVAGAPTAMVCACASLDVAKQVASTLEASGVRVSTTDDVAGVEVAAAYKNVTAIAVGMCEGLSERLPESVYVHRFANARAAVFALGLTDMNTLAEERGGRVETLIGLAGAGDLYVTCLGGRNGNLGRLLGSGQTPEQAMRTIGSTVEGVANTKAALAIAERLGINLPIARAVDAVLSGEASPETAITDALTAVTS
jgi:glycerol-3-phosphate dehydrogenase (NAD(P)+)